MGTITRVFDGAEPASPKQGHDGLKLLDAVSNVIGEGGIVHEGSGGGEGIMPKGGGARGGGSASPAENYFDTCSTLRRPPPPSWATTALNCSMPCPTSSGKRASSPALADPPARPRGTSMRGTTTSAAERYFDASNPRDMADAVSLFTEDIGQVKLAAVL